MQTSQAVQLSELIHRKAADFKKVCEELDDETASSSPSGRWSPKEIVSHLIGPHGIGHMQTIHAFVEQDTPELDIRAEDTFFTEERGRMTFAELLAEFDREYDHVAVFLGGLTEEQLGRKAHLPFLKETPVGEYPTLAEWIRIIGERHLDWHTDHMREVMEALDAGREIARRQASEEAHAVSP